MISIELSIILGKQFHFLWCSIFTLLEHYNDEPLLPAEEKVDSFLKRFIAGASEKMLSLLLQFATGAANIERGSAVKIRSVNQCGGNLVITSDACFKILTLPRQFETFKQFKTIIEGTLLNPLMWGMND